MNIRNQLRQGTRSGQEFVLRFIPCSIDKPCLAFPCDSAGHVEMDNLSQRQLNDYLFARALREREYDTPVVHQIAPPVQ